MLVFSPLKYSEHWQIANVFKLGCNTLSSFHTVTYLNCKYIIFLFFFQALYDHLMDFLADRGIDNTFADELVELSTALEHQEYIHFLENLKKFVKC